MRILSILFWKVLPALVVATIVGRLLGMSGVSVLIAAGILYLAWIPFRAFSIRRGWYTPLDQIRARRAEQQTEREIPPSA